MSQEGGEAEGRARQPVEATGFLLRPLGTREEKPSVLPSRG